MKFLSFIKHCSTVSGIPQKTFKQVLGTAFEEILVLLSQGTKVKIPHFGTFEVRARERSPNFGYIKICQSRLVKHFFNQARKLHAEEKES